MRRALALAAAQQPAAAPDAGGAGTPGRRVAQAARTAEAPQIDGVLNDAVWRQAQPLTDFVQPRPPTCWRSS